MQLQLMQLIYILMLLDDLKSKLTKHLLKTIGVDIITIMIEFFTNETLNENASSEVGTFYNIVIVKLKHFQLRFALNSSTRLTLNLKSTLPDWIAQSMAIALRIFSTSCNNAQIKWI